VTLDVRHFLYAEIPNLESAFPSVRDSERASGVEGDAAHRVGMGAKDAKLGSRFKVPKAHGLIVRAGDKPSIVG
jgi:hypothetical protein